MHILNTRKGILYAILDPIGFHDVARKDESESIPDVEIHLGSKYHMKILAVCNYLWDDSPIESNWKERHVA